MSQLIEQEVPQRTGDQAVLLTAQNIHKKFRSGESDLHILKGADFSLKAGEFVAIEGRSGSGKSTLLHILGALESADGGSTEFEGIDYAVQNQSQQNWSKPPSWSLGYWLRAQGVLIVGLICYGVTLWFLRDRKSSTIWLRLLTHRIEIPLWMVLASLVAIAVAIFTLTAFVYDQRERPRARIRNSVFGFVFQFYHLLPELSAIQNTMLAAMISSPSVTYFNFSRRRAMHQRATELLKQLGMGHRLEHKPSQLSGGERQRVAIARALMNSPKVLFADEPTGNLDAETGRQIMDVLEALHRDHGQTIVMVTHDRTLAREADRVLVLKDGKLQPAV